MGWMPQSPIAKLSDLFTGCQEICHTFMTRNVCTEICHRSVTVIVLEC
jgi:hypothetical protein